MGIYIDTVVTRYSKEYGSKDCETVEEGSKRCIGVIVAIEDLPDFRDDPAITVQWLRSCAYHCNALNEDMRYLLSQLWEIGQAA